MAIKKRKAKVISNKEDIDYLLSLDEDKLTADVISGLFGNFGKGPKYNPYDIVTIPPGSYGPEGKKNKKAFTTTVGLWVFNKFFIEKDLFELFHYINNTVNADVLEGELTKKVSYAFMEGDIDDTVMDNFILKQQFIMTFVTLLSPNLTVDTLTCTKQIEAKKKQLLKKYDKAIKERNTSEIDKMEKELMDYTKELLKDDPAMDIYRSGARGSFGNNFKNMFIMKGLVKDTDPNNGYNLVTSSYMNGVSKEDYPILSNAIIEGPYKRAKKTELGGAWEKLVMSACQHVVIGEEGSDCGTKSTIDVELTKSNYGPYMYNFIVDNGKLVELTSKNIDKYIGKKVKMRFASLCKNKDSGVICHHCAGNMWYRLGITNIGACTPQIPATVKLRSMKAFHDSTVQLIEIDPMKVFSLK